MGVLVDSFEESLDETHAQLLQEEKKNIQNLKSNLTEDECTKVLGSQGYSQWFKFFTKHINHLKNKGNDLAKFWISYLELCELLLILIYATRTGDSKLYLGCVEELLPWVFCV